MKNKNGFTLIELLAIIVILATFLMLVSSKVLESREKAANKAYEVLLETIESSTELYIIDHVSEYEDIDTPGTQIHITLQNLIDDGYIEAPIINPKTRLEIPLTTVITVEVIKAGVIDVQFEI